VITASHHSEHDEIAHQYLGQHPFVLSIVESSPEWLTFNDEWNGASLVMSRNDYRNRAATECSRAGQINGLILDEDVSDLK
jgi:hypothetical protein